ncbi:PP2C family serine/threonine-protein phosphatase [Parafrankia sp. BMG5.11]|uniref:PP2C family protein-serine/threonine phosphatase n=1 Tax=Parafrankia sp. BMG5.11 TaxID=222540 RepID=UPI00103CA916|nr:protein phosphatase 2C domain-containing protein [Parafrankia sp. BMG5.11]TCJ39517.1 serine/threonine-protein phosphatase [Parafrankia sp. BMG5.11]
MSHTPKPIRTTAKIHALTHVGEVRTRNEDAIALSVAEDLVTAWTGEIPLNGGWALLADGMGGHVAGEVASTLAIAVLRPLVSELQSDDQVLRAIEEANRGLYMAMELKRELRGMGTTIVGVVLQDTHALVFNVGDSRAYLYADGELRQLTIDHAIEGQLIQCLGGSQERQPLEPHVTRVQIPTSGILLLCTDGLSDMLDDVAVAALLSPKPANPATILVRAAIEAGGFDNVSVVAISI